MIKYLKLINGDDLIAKVEDHGDHFMVIWPAKIYLDNTDNGPVTRVMPYTPHVLGHSFKLNKTRLIFVADPVPSLEEYYNKNNASMLPENSDASSNDLPNITEQ